MRTFLRIIAFLLIFIGICEAWEFAEIALYGISQKSAVDTVAAYLIANQVDDRIWGRVEDGK